MKTDSNLFNEELFKESLKRDLHAKPVGSQKLNDFGWQMYTSAREAYLSQPWYVRLFYSKVGRMKKAMLDTMAIHEVFVFTAAEVVLQQRNTFMSIVKLSNFPNNSRIK